jgi:hypothetical protein
VSPGQAFSLLQRKWGGVGMRQQGLTLGMVPVRALTREARSLLAAAAVLLLPRACTSGAALLALGSLQAVHSRAEQPSTCQSAEC